MDEEYFLDIKHHKIRPLCFIVALCVLAKHFSSHQTRTGCDNRTGWRHHVRVFRLVAEKAATDTLCFVYPSYFFNTLVVYLFSPKKKLAIDSLIIQVWWLFYDVNLRSCALKTAYYHRYHCLNACQFCAGRSANPAPLAGCSFRVY